ncbi:hypothetical protein GALL_511190 [mine drainage metagenome]|uniref:Uncharacterized protein n=1 Tax=mine drainage metagenome TaxID=410659 RepID=A0A1J5PHM7_9ZZZZ
MEIFRVISFLTVALIGFLGVISYITVWRRMNKIPSVEDFKALDVSGLSQWHPLSKIGFRRWRRVIWVLFLVAVIVNFVEWAGFSFRK